MSSGLGRRRGRWGSRLGMWKVRCRSNAVNDVGRNMNMSTFNQNVPRSRRSIGPSISASLAPAATETLNLPIKSSLGAPKSLSRTSTMRSAVEGTFLTFHVSFQTGVSVLPLTAELRVYKEQEELINVKQWNIHV